MDNFTRQALAVAALLAVVAVSVWAIIANVGNTNLTRQMNDLDQKAYVVCLQQGNSPTECRAGEYGIR